ncbi:hypothetical protein ACTFIW_003559 [Dictyostelium discoideum]
MNSSNLNYLDELVKEYLIFRGFTQTNHYFSLEKKGDKLKGFQVDRILEQINIYISSYDINHLVELWNFLDITFFSKIDYNKSNAYNNNNNNNNYNSNHNSNGSYTSYRNNNNDLQSTIKKLSSSLRKYYVIYAINNNKIDKVKEFFDQYSLELLKDPDWQSWFALPYIRNPQSDPLFEIYFSKTWSEAFSLSLRNFLSTIFKNIPLPKILQFNLERQNRKRLETQVENLLSINEELRSQVDKLEYQNKRDQNNSGSNNNSNNSNNNSGFTIGNVSQRKESNVNNFNSGNDLNSSNEREVNSFSRVSKRFEPRSTSSTNIAAMDDDDNKPMIGIGRSRKSISTNSVNSNNNNNNTSNTNTNTNTNTNANTNTNSNSNSNSNTNTNTNASNNNNNSNNNNGTNTNVTNNNNNNGFQHLNLSGFEMTEIDENGFKKKSSNGLNGSDGIENGELVYNIESQEVCTSHSSAITRCKFLSNGSKIASSSIDGTVRLWNVGFSSRQTTIYCLSEVASLEWENRSKLLLCGTIDSKIKIWNSLTDKAIGDINTSIEFPRVEDIACNPNGNSFATSSINNGRTDGVVYTWNLRTLKTEEKLSSSGAVINSMSFNSTGTLLSTGCVDGTIRIFDIKSGSPIAGWQAHSNEILSVQFSSDENRLYSLGKDGKLYQWNIHSMGKPVKEYDYPGFLVDPHRTTKISFNHNQSSFLVGTNNKFALLYNIDQSSPILQISGHTGPVVTCDWNSSSQSDVIITGSLDKTIRLTKLSKSFNNL